MYVLCYVGDALQRWSKRWEKGNDAGIPLWRRWQRRTSRSCVAAVLLLVALPHIARTHTDQCQDGGGYARPCNTAPLWFSQCFPATVLFRLSREPHLRSERCRDDEVRQRRQGRRKAASRQVWQTGTATTGLDQKDSELHAPPGSASSPPTDAPDAILHKGAESRKTRLPDGFSSYQPHFSHAHTHLCTPCRSLAGSRSASPDVLRSCPTTTTRQTVSAPSPDASATTTISTRGQARWPLSRTYPPLPLLRRPPRLERQRKAPIHRPRQNGARLIVQRRPRSRRPRHGRQQATTSIPSWDQPQHQPRRQCHLLGRMDPQAGRSVSGGRPAWSMCPARTPNASHS